MPSARLATLLALLASGCAAATDDTGLEADAEDSDSGDTGELPAATTVWYIGTSDGQLPDGSYVAPTEEILFIRTVDPAASKVIEEAWSVPARGAVVHYALTHDVNVEDQAFTSSFRTDDGVLFVSGGYDAGPDWAWTAWHSTSIYQDGQYAGTRVESVDQVHDGGVARADKNVYDADDVETWRIVEEITPCTQAEFEAELTAVGG